MLVAPSDQEDYVALNNTGISNMRRGNFDCAIQFFHLAITKVLNGLQQETNKSGQQQVTRNRLISPNLCDTLPASSGNCLNIHETDEIEFHIVGGTSIREGCFSYADHNTVLLHSRLFRFSDNTSESCGAILEDDPRMKSETHFSNLITAILLFNIGLCYHLRSLFPASHRNSTSASTCDIERRKARQMYWNAERILCRLENTLQDLHASQYRVLLAICNNLAHLSFHIFDMHETEVQLHKMQFLLSISISSRDQSEPVSQQDEDENYAHFLWNAISDRVVPRTSPAA